jgi:hypothetical protein
MRGWRTLGRPTRGRVRGGAIVAAVAAIASAGALAACGSSASSAGSADGATSAGTSAVSLATSLSTARDSWAVVPVSANPAFWEVLVRPAKSATWRLVTPPGVADNGGLVAATTASSLTVAVRPSKALLFSPLASTADAGSTWSTVGPLSAGVAASPGALAASGSQLLAVLGDGAIEAGSDDGASWRTIAKPGAIAASAAGKKCGTVGVTSVSFGLSGSELLAAGSCGTTGTTGIFSRSFLTAPGGWQRVSLPVSGHLVRLFAGGTVLMQAKAGLTALWATGWSGYAGLASSPPPTGGWKQSAPLPVTGTVTASGELAGSTPAAADGAWVLLPGGRAATISGPGQQWLLLPPVPAAAKVLASGPNGAVDALAASGATLTVWRLAHAATVWTKIQSIAVPIQFGSSS